MKRMIISLVVAMMLIMALAGSALAHAAPPCNDADGDGSPSGREYAKHHISALAKVGGLGNDAHKPGSHQGFSVCDPSGRGAF